jgi:hypothetical protein
MISTTYYFLILTGVVLNGSSFCKTRSGSVATGCNTSHAHCGSFLCDFSLGSGLFGSAK